MAAADLLSLNWAAAADLLSLNLKRAPVDLNSNLAPAEAFESGNPKATRYISLLLVNCGPRSWELRGVWEWKCCYRVEII